MSESLRFLADKDFDNDILRGMLRRLPNLDIVRAQDVGLSGALDSRVLEWAAMEGRVLLTHAHALSMRRKYTAMSVCAHTLRIKGNVSQSRECVSTTWRVEFLVHRGSNAEVAADGDLGPPDSYLTRSRIFHRLETLPVSAAGCGVTATRRRFSL